MKNLFAHWRWLLLLILLAAIYWQLPIGGTVLVSSLPIDPNAHFPQYIFNPPSPQPGDEVSISITDNVPWTHVKLTVNDEPATFVQTQALPLRNQWNWSWRVTLPAAPQSDQTTLEFYRDCDSGCRLRDQRTIEPFATAGSTLPKPFGKPTKLCVAFPNPQRDWHGRSGWVTDLTYAQTNESYWQIDALAQRVAQSHQAGQRVLVRVDYAPQQGIPPTDNIEALDRYLVHMRKLSRDERLTNVYAFIIGTGFNSLDSNQLSLDAPTTPQWYAQVFNGNFNLEKSEDRSGSNVIQVVRTNNPLVRVLIGPVRPWSSDQRGSARSTEAAPWLGYMDTLTLLIDENVAHNLDAGIALTEPDGFALNVPGRVDSGDSNESFAPALEPTLSITSTQTFGAQAGFGIYQDWLNIINRYPSTRGKAAYITSTNTFTYNHSTAYNHSTTYDHSTTSGESKPTTPAQNYPPDWLTNALSIVNHEPQIQSLCWFLDLIPGDQRWQGFSLSQGEGRMKDVADEFDRLLRDE